MRRWRALILATTACAAASVALAELPVEEIGRSETLARHPDPHWVLVTDLLLRRAALLDLDAGTFLGMVSTGYMSQAGAFPRHDDSEFYWPETFYSRGVRGERTDVVTFYDTRTLAPIDEVVIPAKRATNVLPSANTAVSDDDRFLAIFNMTPATSLTIVDLVERRLAGEIATPGCALVYAAGDRRFFSLCGDGGWLLITLDDRGQEVSRVRGAPFFDPETDPVTEKAVRWGDVWIFVSFGGVVHPLDVAGEELAPGEPWPLISAEEEEDRWRIGGIQHLAVHEATGRLYSLTHQGDEFGHKEAGSHLWVYDLATHERVQDIELRHPGISLISETIEVGRDWPPPFDGLWDWVLDHLVPNPGLDQVQVTQDEEPLLVTGSQIGGSVAVYDARSGEFLRRVASGNLTVHVLQAPWGRAR